MELGTASQEKPILTEYLAVWKSSYIITLCYIYINMGLYLATYSQLLWYYGYIMLMYPIRKNELNNTRVSCQVCSIDYDNPHQLWGSGTPFSHDHPNIKEVD